MPRLIERVGRLLFLTLAIGARFVLILLLARI